MLNLISDFVHSDADVQSLIEQVASLQLKKTFEKNLQFFKLFKPEIYHHITHHKIEHYSVFCSKDDVFNIVEIDSGRVLYSEDPLSEIWREVGDFCNSAPVVELIESDSVTNVRPLDSDPVIFIFGIGLGFHIKDLLKLCSPKILVIYEPVLDLFISSLHIIDWGDIFRKAEYSKTIISLQIAQSGSNITADLNELTQLVPDLSRFFIYRHLAHSVSDDVFCYLIKNSGKREKLLHSSRQFVGYVDDNLFIPERVTGILGNNFYSEKLENTLYLKNVQALKRYYPTLYDVLSRYKPQNWHCVEDNENINLYCKTRPALFYKDLIKDSEKIVDRFFKKPLENKVILNQGGIEKFRSYVHYKAIAKMQPFLTKMPVRKFSDISDIENLIILGVGLGCHIEKLLQRSDIKNLFIFEPNIDFFYASLFVSNWWDLFEKAEEKKQRFYFNIGGAGDEYFNDIMGQYYQVGAYGIAKSLILPSFLTPGMKKSLSKLYSQLQIIMAMGENFDHVRYGIAHSSESIRLGHNFLKNKRDSQSLFLLQDVPVFIVGNGPSLDESYYYIKEHRENVIVVSCGTALRSLYKLGITPDFHAEIEQNRATYSWVSQVDDPNWLKLISFLSVSGVHPDTASLFKSVYLTFKDGESSTNYLRDLFHKQDINISSLSYSYPTVSNFVLDFFTELGFKQIYLFGVDLGYLNSKSHHSRHSAYFRDDGAAVVHADVGFSDELKVTGNFRSEVLTKPEFDFSRSILEAKIRNTKSKLLTVYNCSDGVFIDGTIALLPKNILVKNSEFDIKLKIDAVFSDIFYSLELKEYYEELKGALFYSRFPEVVSSLIENLNEISSAKEAGTLIEKQWSIVINCYHGDDKLPFYLTCGSTLYMLSVLTRFLPSGNAADSEDVVRFNSLVSIWKDYLNDACKLYKSAPMSFCSVDVDYYFKM